MEQMSLRRLPYMEQVPLLGVQRALYLEHHLSLIFSILSCH